MSKIIDDYKKVNKILDCQGPLFISKMIKIVFISQYHNNLLVNYIKIAKI